MGPGWNINSTVTNSIVNTFICPSDGMSPIAVPAGAQWSGRLNNYFASVGTTPAYQGASDTTGVFTQAGRAYGVQNITDGTSNTIAFGESLVGPDSGGYQTKSQQELCRDGPTSRHRPPRAGQPLRRQPERQAVLADLQTCQWPP